MRYMVDFCQACIMLGTGKTRYVAGRPDTEYLR